MAQFTQLTNVLRGSGFSLINNIKEELTNQDKVASGKLRNTMRFEIQDSGTLITLIFKAQDYWVNVDKGRRKGAKFPKVNKIKSWIKQKGLSLGGKSLNSVTFAIGKSISDFGIKPTNIYTNATNEYVKGLLKIIATSGLPDVQKQSREILRQLSTTKVEFRK